MNKKLRNYFANPYYAHPVFDKLCIAYFFFWGAFGIWFDWFVLIPHYYYPTGSNPLPLKVYIHYLGPFFILINVLINYYKIISNPSHIDVGPKECLVMDPVSSTQETRETSEAVKETSQSGRSIIPVIRKQEDSLFIVNKAVESNDEKGSQDGRFYCGVCDVAKPPRSHHCKKCDVCILKRDHHCPFSGTCIGYFNQRYYISMLFYLSCGITYAVVFQFDFLCSILGHLGLLLPLYMIAPHFCLAFQLISFYEFLICILTLKTILFFFFINGVFLQQLALLIRGQTHYERKVGSRAYDRGFVENARVTLGRRWYIAWLFPLIDSKMLGVGTRFDQNFKLI